MEQLYIHTPLLYSHTLSLLTQKKIYLKVEVLQPSGSFKDRGIGALCLHYAQQKVNGFVCSSGGNAGMAVAYASRALKIPATIVIPETTPPIMIQKLQVEEATVIVKGENWNIADEVAKQLAQEKGFAYIPPFDHPLIWQGYTHLVEELKSDNIKPDAIILSVGGGGLFSGIVQGLQSIGWHDVAMITAETEGAASFAISMKEKKRIILPKIETIAVTLGAKQICQQAFNLSQKHPTYSETVTDQEAVKACLQFANDHRLLVEPACGAALALLYEKREVLEQFESFVIIVCGGNGISLALLEQWKKQFKIT